MPIYKMEGKRDGLQKYRVRHNYVDEHGIARQTDKVVYGSDAAKELDRELLQRKYAIPKHTVAELCEEYVRIKSHEIRETSLDTLKKIIRLRILPYLGEEVVEYLNAAALQSWKQTLEETGWSLKTKQDAYGELRAVLQYAIRMEYIEKNPLPQVGNFKDAYKTKPEIFFYTPEEFKRYINIPLKRQEWNYYVFFNIAFYTGLRKGEIHALKWTDIDGEYLTVSRSIAQKLKGPYRETPPKNLTSCRRLQIPKPLMVILRDQKERQKMMEGFTEDFRVCGGPVCLCDTGVDHANRRYAEQAGIKRIRIHDFRHSHASLLANAGINILEISKRLGHAKVEITLNTYSHLYPKEEERAVSILNAV